MSHYSLNFIIQSSLIIFGGLALELPSCTKICATEIPKIKWHSTVGPQILRADCTTNIIFQYLSVDIGYSG